MNTSNRNRETIFLNFLIIKLFVRVHGWVSESKYRPLRQGVARKKLPDIAFGRRRLDAQGLLAHRVNKSNFHGMQAYRAIVVGSVIAVFDVAFYRAAHGS